MDAHPADCEVGPVVSPLTDFSSPALIICGRAPAAGRLNGETWSNLASDGGSDIYTAEVLQGESVCVVLFFLRRVYSSTVINTVKTEEYKGKVALFNGR